MPLCIKNQNSFRSITFGLLLIHFPALAFISSAEEKSAYEDIGSIRAS
jgi:hypothetical protein